MDSPIVPEVEVSYVTYENRNNPHVTVHVEGCGQIRKRGGSHKYGQGKYEDHDTLSEARTYATSTGLSVADCSFCRPSLQAPTP